MSALAAVLLFILVFMVLPSVFKVWFSLSVVTYSLYPDFYYKAEMVLPIKGIRTGKVRRRRVFVYIMHEDRSLGLPSARYARTVAISSGVVVRDRRIVRPFFAIIRTSSGNGGFLCVL